MRKFIAVLMLAAAVTFSNCAFLCAVVSNKLGKKTTSCQESCHQETPSPENQSSPNQHKNCCDNFKHDLPVLLSGVPALDKPNLSALFSTRNLTAFLNLSTGRDFFRQGRGPPRIFSSETLLASKTPRAPPALLTGV